MSPCCLFRQHLNYIDAAYLCTAFVLIVTARLLMEDGGVAKVPTRQLAYRPRAVFGVESPSLVYNHFLMREEPISFIAGELREELSNPSRQRNAGCPPLIRSNSLN